MRKSTTVLAFAIVACGRPALTQVDPAPVERVSRATAPPPISSAGDGGAIVAAQPAASTDTRGYVTTFRFEVKFADSTVVFDQDRATVVRFPPGVLWQCQRNQTAVVDTRRRGSFACSTDNWKTSVLTIVGCRLEQEDAERAAAMRIIFPTPAGASVGDGAGGFVGADGGAPPSTWVDLTVSCKTTRGP